MVPDATDILSSPSIPHKFPSGIQINQNVYMTMEIVL